MFVIGRNPILETLRYDHQSIRKIILLNKLSDKKIKLILALSAQNRIPVEFKSKNDFDKLFSKKDKSEGISQGIVAEVDEFKYTDLDDVIDKLNKKSSSLLVFLDEIQDPHNLGAIIRSSSAAGADAVIISEKNSAKVNHTVIKASSGATNYLDIILANNTVNAIKKLKEQAFKIIGTTLKKGTLLYDFEFSGHSCIIFGNEGEGIRKNILKLCDHFIKIPIEGKVESLNVSVAAGVILYEALRQKMND